MNPRYKAGLGLAFLVLVFTLYTILLKIGGGGVGLIPNLFYGFLIGLVVSFGVSFGLDRGRGLVSILKQPRVVLLVAVTGLVNNALTQLFLGMGTLGTNPSIASIVFRSWIIMIALLTPLTLRQKVNSKQMLAIFVGFLGLYVVVSGGTLSSFNAQQMPYMGLLLASAMCATFAGLIMNRYTFSPTGTVAIFNLVSFAFISLVVMGTHTSLNVVFTPASAIAVLFMGIFAYGVGTTLYYYSLKALGQPVVSNVILIVPFLTILFSTVLTNTPIQAYYILAALLISVGIVLQRRYSALPERITKKRVLDQISIFDVTSAFVSNKNPEIGGHVAGGNRAFAVKLNATGFSEMSHGDTFSKYGCVSFTTKKPHMEAQHDEIEFIKEIMDIKNEDIALIGMGNPQKLEDAFAEFISESQQKPLPFPKTL